MLKQVNFENRPIEATHKTSHTQFYLREMVRIGKSTK